MPATPSTLSSSSQGGRTTVQKGNESGILSLYSGQLISILLSAIDWIGATMAVENTTVVTTGGTPTGSRKGKTVTKEVSVTYRWGQVTDIRYHPEIEKVQMSIVYPSSSSPLSVIPVSSSPSVFPSSSVSSSPLKAIPSLPSATSTETSVLLDHHTPENTAIFTTEWYDITSFFRSASIVSTSSASASSGKDKLTLPILQPTRLYVQHSSFWIPLARIIPHQPTLGEGIDPKEIGSILWPVNYITSFEPFTTEHDKTTVSSSSLSSSTSAWIQCLPFSKNPEHGSPIMVPLATLLSGTTTEDDYRSWSMLPTDWNTCSPINQHPYTSSTLNDNIDTHKTLSSSASSSSSQRNNKKKSASSHPFNSHRRSRGSNKSKTNSTTTNNSSTVVNQENNNDTDSILEDEGTDDVLPTPTFATLSPAYQLLYTQRYEVYLQIQERLRKQYEYQQQWIYGIFTIFHEQWGLSNKDYEMIISQYLSLLPVSSSASSASSSSSSSSSTLSTVTKKNPTTNEITTAMKNKYINLLKTDSTALTALSYTCYDGLRGSINNEDSLDPILQEYYNDQKEHMKAKFEETKKILEQQEEQDSKLLAKEKRRKRDRERKRRIFELQRMQKQQQQQQQEQQQISHNSSGTAMDTTDDNVPNNEMLQPFLLPSNNINDIDDTDDNVDMDEDTPFPSPSENDTLMNNTSTSIVSTDSLPGKANSSNTNTSLESSTLTVPLLPCLSRIDLTSSDPDSSSSSLPSLFLDNKKSLSIRHIAKQFPSYRAKYTHPSAWVGRWIAWTTEDSKLSSMANNLPVYSCHLGAYLDTVASSSSSASSKVPLDDTRFPPSFFTAITGRDLAHQVLNSTKSDIVPEPTVHDLLSTLHKRWKEVMQHKPAPLSSSTTPSKSKAHSSSSTAKNPSSSSFVPRYKWMVAWVARYDPVNQQHLIVYDWPASLGYSFVSYLETIGSTAASNVPNLVTQEWIPALGSTNGPFIKTNPMVSSSFFKRTQYPVIILPRTGPLASLRLPVIFDSNHADILGTEPRCSWCFHTASATNPLLACTRGAYHHKTDTNASLSLPVCGRYSHLHCLSLTELQQTFPSSAHASVPAVSSSSSLPLVDGLSITVPTGSSLSVSSSPSTAQNDRLQRFLSSPYLHTLAPNVYTYDDIRTNIHGPTHAPSFIIAPPVNFDQPLWSCSACIRCSMCGSHSSRGSIVDTLLVQEWNERVESKKKLENKRDTKEKKLARTKTNATNNTNVNGTDEYLTNDPFLPLPKLIWQSATYDDRGGDIEHAQWYSRTYKPVPGDVAYQSRLYASQGHPVQTLPYTESKADRIHLRVQRLFRLRNRRRLRLQAKKENAIKPIFTDDSAEDDNSEDDEANEEEDSLFVNETEEETFQRLLKDEPDYDYDGPLRYDFIGVDLSAPSPLSLLEHNHPVSRTTGTMDGQSSRTHTHHSSQQSTAGSIIPSEPIALTLCSPCQESLVSGAFCPLCHSIYRQDSGHMLACDHSCKGWVHARCDGLSPDDLSAIEKGHHPVWGAHYLCPVCRHAAMLMLLRLLRWEDRAGYFVLPVTAEVAPGYFNVIKYPMDLATMGVRLSNGYYDRQGIDGIQAFRADAELIVKNALVFNTPQDRVYRDAWRFLRIISNHFSRIFPMTTDATYRNDFEKLRLVVKDPNLLQEASLATTIAEADAAISTMSSNSKRSGLNSKNMVSILSGGKDALSNALLSTAHDIDYTTNGMDDEPTNSTALVPVSSSKMNPKSGSLDTRMRHAGADRHTTTATNDELSSSSPGNENSSIEVQEEDMASRVAMRNAMLYGTTGTGADTLSNSRSRGGRSTGTTTDHERELANRRAEASLPEEYRPLPLAIPTIPSCALVLPELRLSSHEGSLLSTTDICTTCGSSGEPELMMFCMDCGEAHHIYCSAPTVFTRLLMESASQKLGLKFELIRRPDFTFTPGYALSSLQLDILHSVEFRTLFQEFRGSLLWRCGNCKVCEICGECSPMHEDRLLVCDACDAGYHTFCLQPQVHEIPEESWYCARCIHCSTCGATGALHPVSSLTHTIHYPPELKTLILSNPDYRLSPLQWSTNMLECNVCTLKRTEMELLTYTNVQGYYSANGFLGFPTVNLPARQLLQLLLKPAPVVPSLYSSPHNNNDHHHHHPNNTNSFHRSYVSNAAVIVKPRPSSQYVPKPKKIPVVKEKPLPRILPPPPPPPPPKRRIPADNECSSCEKVWKPYTNEEDGDMMACDGCGRWVHVRCDTVYLPRIVYDCIASFDADETKYFCILCREGILAEYYRNKTLTAKERKKFPELPKNYCMDYVHSFVGHIRRIRSALQTAERIESIAQNAVTSVQTVIRDTDESITNSITGSSDAPTNNDGIRPIPKSSPSIPKETVVACTQKFCSFLDHLYGIMYNPVLFPLWNNGNIPHLPMLQPPLYSRLQESVRTKAHRYIRSLSYVSPLKEARASIRWSPADSSHGATSDDSNGTFFRVSEGIPPDQALVNILGQVSGALASVLVLREYCLLCPQQSTSITPDESNDTTMGVPYEGIFTLPSTMYSIAKELLLSPIPTLMAQSMWLHNIAYTLGLDFPAPPVPETTVSDTTGTVNENQTENETMESVDPNINKGETLDESMAIEDDGSAAIAKNDNNHLMQRTETLEDNDALPSDERTHKRHRETTEEGDNNDDGMMVIHQTVPDENVPMKETEPTVSENSIPLQHGDNTDAVVPVGSDDNDTTSNPSAKRGRLLNEGESNEAQISTDDYAMIEGEGNTENISLVDTSTGPTNENGTVSTSVSSEPTTPGVQQLPSSSSSSSPSHASNSSNGPFSQSVPWYQLEEEISRTYKPFVLDYPVVSKPDIKPLYGLQILTHNNAIKQIYDVAKLAVQAKSIPPSVTETVTGTGVNTLSVTTTVPSALPISLTSGYELRNNLVHGTFDDNQIYALCVDSLTPVPGTLSSLSTLTPTVITVPDSRICLLCGQRGDLDMGMSKLMFTKNNPVDNSTVVEDNYDPSLLKGIEGRLLYVPMPVSGSWAHSEESVMNNNANANGGNSNGTHHFSTGTSSLPPNAGMTTIPNSFIAPTASAQDSSSTHSHPYHLPLTYPSSSCTGGWIHTQCCIWSDGVYDTTGNGDLQGVQAAIRNGSRSRCFHCGYIGATIYCRQKTCPRVYHFRCAIISGCSGLVLSEKRNRLSPFIVPSPQFFCDTHTRIRTHEDQALDGVIDENGTENNENNHGTMVTGGAKKRSRTSTGTRNETVTMNELRSGIGLHPFPTSYHLLQYYHQFPHVLEAIVNIHELWSLRIHHDPIMTNVPILSTTVTATGGGTTGPTTTASLGTNTLTNYNHQQASQHSYRSTVMKKRTDTANDDSLPLIQLTKFILSSSTLPEAAKGPQTIDDIELNGQYDEEDTFLYENSLISKINQYLSSSNNLSSLAHHHNHHSSGIIANELVHLFSSLSVSSRAHDSSLTSSSSTTLSTTITPRLPFLRQSILSLFPGIKNYEMFENAVYELTLLASSLSVSSDGYYTLRLPIHRSSGLGSIGTGVFGTGNSNNSGNATAGVVPNFSAATSKLWLYASDVSTVEMTEDGIYQDINLHSSPTLTVTTNSNDDTKSDKGLTGGSSSSSVYTLPTIAPPTSAPSSYPVLRVGGLTVLRWGRIITRRPGYHTKSFLYPVGFRARRIWWGPSTTLDPDKNTYQLNPQQPLVRVSYTLDIIDTQGPPLDTFQCRLKLYQRKYPLITQLPIKEQYTHVPMEELRYGPLFMLTCDSYPSLQIVGFTPDDIFTKLRYTLREICGTQFTAHLISREEQLRMDFLQYQRFKTEQENASTASTESAGIPSVPYTESLASSTTAYVYDENGNSTDPSLLNRDYSVAHESVVPPLHNSNTQPSFAFDQYLGPQVHGTRLRWRTTLPIPSLRTEADGLSLKDALKNSIGLQFYPNVGTCNESYGITGHIWFGIGIPAVQRALESLPDTAFTMITPVGSSSWWPRYNYRYLVPSPDSLNQARSLREVNHRKDLMYLATMEDTTLTTPPSNPNVTPTTMTTNAAPLLLSSRLVPYDRADRVHTRHHATSLLASARGTSLFTLLPEVLDIDRIAMGDLPLPEVRILAATADSDGTGDGIGNSNNTVNTATATNNSTNSITNNANSNVLSGNTGASALTNDVSVSTMYYPSATNNPLVLQRLWGSDVMSPTEWAYLNTPTVQNTNILSYSEGKLLLTEINDNSNDGSGSSSSNGTVAAITDRYTNADEAAAAVRYRQMRSWIMSTHLCVRRSPIHGWGLFLRVDKPRDTVLIEYTGQAVREPVADRREIIYEEEARETGRFQHMSGKGIAMDSSSSSSNSTMALSSTKESMIMHPHTIDKHGTSYMEADQHGLHILSSPSRSSKSHGTSNTGANVDEVEGYDMSTFFHVPIGDRRSDGSGSCYLFRLDEEYIIDATYKGSSARFINHSCEPNCYSRILAVDGARRIVICALRDLRAGEELTYNYKFAIETDPRLKIPCYCGAPSCWGTMN